MNKKALYSSFVNIAKKIAGIPQNDGLDVFNFLKYKHLKYGPYFYKKQFTTEELIAIMKEMGMKKGSNIFIHSSWSEFYNYKGTESDFINQILEVIGSEGTLIMPAYPFLQKNKVFNVKNTVTKAGLLAEVFRRYPGVKRSINTQHSVCAFGPQSDFLLHEHHLGDNCWDEKSPYYKLAKIDALVFDIGLHKRFVGTMHHCVEGILSKELPYFRDMFTDDKVEHKYIDYDGLEKTYYCYDSKKKRIYEYFHFTKYVDKYLKYDHRKISNLDITVYHASQVIPTMIENGRKGIVIYSRPSTKNYRFICSDND